MKRRLIIAAASIALFAACKGNRGYEIVNNKDINPSADTAAISTDTALTEGSKLVKRADISFKVKNVQQTGDSVSQLTRRYNGMVTHHQMSSSVSNSRDVKISDDSVMRISSFDTHADMTVKLPSEKLEDFINTVSHWGIYVTQRQMDIEDKSLDYLSERLKLQNRREMVAQQKTGKIKIKNPEAVLWLKDDMIDGQINNKRIDDAVKYSTISLNFYQSNTILKEMIANDNPAAYQLPFGKRLAMALANGWQIFVDLILALANLWVLVLAAVAAFAGYKAYKKKYPAMLKV